MDWIMLLYIRLWRTRASCPIRPIFGLNSSATSAVTPNRTKHIITIICKSMTSSTRPRQTAMINSDRNWIHSSSREKTPVVSLYTVRSTSVIFAVR